MKAPLRFFVLLLLSCSLQSAFAKRAPNLELKDLAGKTHKIADLRGSIAVVNFWATFCGPCREELPMLSRLTQEYSGRHIRFIAISADEIKDRAKVDRFLGANPLAMEIWTGADVDMLERAGLGNVLPGTMILDEQGEVIARVMGQAREEDVRQPLDWLLSGRSGATPSAVTKRY